MSFIAGFVVGSLVNMGLIRLGYQVVAMPAGFDGSSQESFLATAHLLQPINFLFPFLAHALGTFAGALVAYLMASSQRALLALGLGALTLVGGILAAMMIPAPAWFIAADLLLAYLPMAWLAARIGHRILAKRAASATNA